jgi:hypothetical protein
MKLLINTPKCLLPVALLLMVGAVSTQAAFAAPPMTAEMKVAFTYDPASSAADLYSNLERTARDACDVPGVRSARQHLQEQQCAQQLLGAAVDRIGRADLAQLHQGHFTTQASRPSATAG